MDTLVEPCIACGRTLLTFALTVCFAATCVFAIVATTGALGQ